MLYDWRNKILDGRQCCLPGGPTVRAAIRAATGPNTMPVVQELSGKRDDILSAFAAECRRCWREGTPMPDDDFSPCTLDEPEEPGTAPITWRRMRWFHEEADAGEIGAVLYRLGRKIDRLRGCFFVTKKQWDALVDGWHWGRSWTKNGDEWQWGRYGLPRKQLTFDEFVEIVRALNRAEGET